MLKKCFVGIFLNLNVALIVLGFQTPHCTHEQLEAKLAEYFKCTAQHANKELDAIFGQSQDHQNNIALRCSFLDQEIACFKDNIVACFDEELSNDVATLLDYSYKGLPYVQCKRIDGIRGGRVEGKVLSIVEKYKQYIQNPEKLLSIITTDKQCSTDLLIQSVDNDMNCLINQFETAGAEFTNSIAYLAHGYNTSVPICTMIDDALNCISAGHCLSQNEVDFLRNTGVTTYNFLMKIMNQMYQRAGGSFEELVKRVGADEDLDTMTYEEKLQFNKIGDNLLKMVLDDYMVCSNIKHKYFLYNFSWCGVDLCK